MFALRRPISQLIKNALIPTRQKLFSGKISDLKKEISNSNNLAVVDSKILEKSALELNISTGKFQPSSITTNNWWL